jgi:hypothetical protein
LKGKVTQLNEVIKQQQDKLAEVTKKANKLPKDDVLKLSFESINGTEISSKFR